MNVKLAQAAGEFGVEEALDIFLGGSLINDVAGSRRLL